MNRATELDETIESIDESIDLINMGYNMTFYLLKSDFYLTNI